MYVYHWMPAIFCHVRCQWGGVAEMEFVEIFLGNRFYQRLGEISSDCSEVKLLLIMNL